eukprot:8542599-Pyramimonas_sp.AAC.1
MDARFGACAVDLALVDARHLLARSLASARRRRRRPRSRRPSARRKSRDPWRSGRGPRGRPLPPGA